GGVLNIHIFLLVAMVVAMLIVVGLSHWALAGAPFYTQVVTALVYMGAMFLFVFFRTRGFNTGYDLNEEAVRERLPHLLVIHAAFLAWVFSMQAVASLARPHLSPHWFKEYSGHHTLFADVGILFYVSTGMAQVLISRGILRRSVEAFNNRLKTAANANITQDDRM